MLPKDRKLNNPACSTSHGLTIGKKLESSGDKVARGTLSLWYTNKKSVSLPSEKIGGEFSIMYSSVPSYRDAKHGIVAERQ